MLAAVNDNAIFGDGVQIFRRWTQLLRWPHLAILSTGAEHLTRTGVEELTTL
jgi:hypothetical protein